MPIAWLFERTNLKWWLIALLIRGGFFWVFLQEHGFHHSLYGWGMVGGDTHSYLEPIDELIVHGHYQPDLRMPGYGAVYFVLRHFTTEPGAGVVLIFLQLVLSARACAAMRRIAGLMALNKRWQLLLFWLCATCPQLAALDVQLATESFCTSALILAMLHFTAHLQRPSAFSLLAAGAWLAWAVFLRPVFALALPLLAVGLLLHGAVNTRRRMRDALFLLLPFLLVDGAWTWRNWRTHHQIRPLANSVYYPEFKDAPTFAIFQVLQAYGGNQAWWDPRADIRWFNVREGEMARPGRLVDGDIEPPEVAFSERCTRDSLLALADDMRLWSDSTTSSEERGLINARATARAGRLVQYLHEDRPFVFHAWSRVRLLGIQLRRAGLNGLFETHFRGDPFFAPVVVFWNDLWYWALMPLGLFGAVVAVARWRVIGPDRRILALFLLAFTLVHPFVFRMCEGRYLLPMYPWLAWCAVSLFIRPGKAAHPELEGRSP